MPEQQLEMIDHDIVPAHLAVQAMRDNGYKNAGYALAELMDNSIQAEATVVELLCAERVQQLANRRRSRIHQIAVLDNGTGMDSGKLRMALQFGNGTHLAANTRGGIGKFGMGLPSSSVSQCSRVDVWTWQDGPNSAIHSYLDLEEIRSGRLREVPKPEPSGIPEVWMTAGSEWGESGTLVVWSNLDRIMWKTARSIIDNSDYLIGRMYRRFLADGQLTIRMVAFDADRPADVSIDRSAVPNDPLYLMRNTSTPKPFDVEPMFELWGEPVVMKVRHNNKDSEVRITFSVARAAAREGDQAGSRAHGTHAKKNVGVSVVRAGRELDMEQSWVIQYDPKERWWGVEVEFSPELDDVFGVSNNKQAARNFHKLDINSFMLEGETEQQLRERLAEEEDPVGPLLEISELIDRNLGVIRRLLDAQNRGTRRARQRHEDRKAEVIATKETKIRQEEGHHGESDDTERLPPGERERQIEDYLKAEGLTDAAAHGIAAQTVHAGLKYVLAEAAMQSAAFFSVTPKAGTVIITLNTEHPAYGSLVEALENDDEDPTLEAIKTRLANARMGLRLLLLAWARYEDELSGGRRQQAQDARFDWGRIARQFIAGAE